MYLTSRVGEGTCGTLHLGTIKVEKPTKTGETAVFVKLAFTDDERRAVSHEYLVSLHLASRGVSGIPETLGLFQDEGDGPSCLVHSLAGLSLRETRKRITSSQR